QFQDVHNAHFLWLIFLFQLGTLLWSAETAARRGAFGEAVDRVKSYEALVARVGSLEGLAWFPSHGVAARVWGLVCAARGDVTEASAHFARSIETLREHGYAPDLARSYMALGEFDAARGASARAREAFDQAIEHFRQIGFGRELDQAIAARARVV
ncbi:MAG: hypothetical protein DMD81_19540, partial [Candidatus Rokuibacteriota bacterium]